MTPSDEHTERALDRERNEASMPEDDEGGATIINLALLPAGAHPMPFAELDVEEVPSARHLDCDDYGGCLDFAAHVRWRGFHCRRCPRFSSQAPLPSGHDRPLAPVIRLTARSAT